MLVDSAHSLFSCVSPKVMDVLKIFGRLLILSRFVFYLLLLLFKRLLFKDFVVLAHYFRLEPPTGWLWVRDIYCKFDVGLYKNLDCFFRIVFLLWLFIILFCCGRWTAINLLIVISLILFALLIRGKKVLNWDVVLWRYPDRRLFGLYWSFNPPISGNKSSLTRKRSWCETWCFLLWGLGIFLVTLD